MASRQGLLHELQESDTETVKSFDEKEETQNILDTLGAWSERNFHRRAVLFLLAFLMGWWSLVGIRIAVKKNKKRKRSDEPRARKAKIAGLKKINLLIQAHKPLTHKNIQDNAETI